MIINSVHFVNHYTDNNGETGKRGDGIDMMTLRIESGQQNKLANTIFGSIGQPLFHALDKIHYIYIYVSCTSYGYLIFKHCNHIIYNFYVIISSAYIVHVCLYKNSAQCGICVSVKFLILLIHISYTSYNIFAFSYICYSHFQIISIIIKAIRFVYKIL